MIVILCDSYKDAQDYFDIFLDFLEYSIPCGIKKLYEACQCVITDDDLGYIFIDRRMEDVFINLKDPSDIIDVDEFFQDCEISYFLEYIS